MSKATTRKSTEQFQTLVADPARAYGSLTLEYYEKLFSAQLEAARRYTELGFAQARAWVDVRDVDGFNKALEGQQKAAEQLNEQLKGDAEALSGLGQEYLQKGQQLVESSMKSATAAAK
ncbi:phasin family protein [Halomonas mongoliensis]|uniref:phasin family protein n=1 Tax=Halomonas mongoliensis TaxID=321265 RepID=UPI00403AE9EE